MVGRQVSGSPSRLRRINSSIASRNRSRAVAPYGSPASDSASARRAAGIAASSPRQSISTLAAWKNRDLRPPTGAPSLADLISSLLGISHAGIISGDPLRAGAFHEVHANMRAASPYDRVHWTLLLRIGLVTEKGKALEL